MHFFRHFFHETFGMYHIFPTFAPVKQNNGAIAQLVEQRTENPCVPGSIPGGTTENQAATLKVAAFFIF